MTRNRIWLLAVIASLLMAAASLVFRAPWRDEYWTLYIAGGDTSWAEMLTTRQMNDIHPPLAYFPLHIWDGIFQSELAARLLNVFYITGGFALAWFAGRDRKTETGLYLLIAATSFWFVFYGVEVRNYALLFSLVVPAVVVARRAFMGEKIDPVWSVVWLFLAMAMSLTHYYGALLAGATGLVAGLSLLFKRRFAGFVAIGVISALAVAPTVAWLVLKNFGHTVAAYSIPKDISFVTQMTDGADQLLRGLIIKTIFANLAIAIAAFMAARMLMRKAERNDGVLLWSMVIVIVLAFAAQSFAISIKERSFIVIIPPLFYLAARALPLAEEKGGFVARCARWAPILAIATPFLFIPEHFKDREELGEVRDVIASSHACANEPMLAVYRPTPQSPGFQPWFNRRVLAPTPGGPPRLIESTEAKPQDIAAVMASRCPIKALAFSLRRNNQEDQSAAREALTRAGLDLARLEEVDHGEGRSLVFQTR